MRDQPYIRESVARAAWPAALGEKYCAYNQTRERFLCAEVAAGEFTGLGLEERLRLLTPESSAALWILPFRGISPTAVSTPIDLVYLDHRNVVIDAVESFPLASISASRAPAASVLALPAGAIAAAETRPGDQLALCTPEEMKRLLRRAQLARPKSEVESLAEHGSGAAAPSRAGRLLPWVDRSRNNPGADTAIAPANAPSVMPDPTAVPTTMPQTPSIANTSQPAAAESATSPRAAEIARLKAAPRNWLQRLLNSQPDDPRASDRETVEGLAAFFFTGGGSAPHAIRDVSRTGLYVCTEERWYPGTVVRITLTDQRAATAESSVTVNARVVRWGNDGVGMQFAFPDLKALRNGRSASMESLAGGASQTQLELFLKSFRTGTGNCQ